MVGGPVFSDLSSRLQPLDLAWCLILGHGVSKYLYVSSDASISLDIRKQEVSIAGGGKKDIQKSKYGTFERPKRHYM